MAQYLSSEARRATRSPPPPSSFTIPRIAPRSGFSGGRLGPPAPPPPQNWPGGPPRPGELPVIVNLAPRRPRQRTWMARERASGSQPDSPQPASVPPPPPANWPGGRQPSRPVISSSAPQSVTRSAYIVSRKAFQCLGANSPMWSRVDLESRCPCN